MEEEKKDSCETKETEAEAKEDVKEEKQEAEVNEGTETEESGSEKEEAEDKKEGKEEKPKKGLFGKNKDSEKEKLITENPLYGKIICRCEQITEAEIVEAIHRPVGARSVDAIKRRVRAGMGRCQGGFCGPQVIEILARELGVDPEDIKKRGGDSYMLCRE